ncbi:hypothetical protein MAR_005953 [Mya arenaria]|uniref:Uncharacterized protein n=1 Tax=Mya arenaria TaxID=6604 RepID=A0ABY7D9K0_MYAAR|nr:hypothetical protein MAR_005953 [Mya arenaria]
MDETLKKGANADTVSIWGKKGSASFGVKVSAFGCDRAIAENVTNGNTPGANADTVSIWGKKGSASFGVKVSAFGCDRAIAENVTNGNTPGVYSLFVAMLPAFTGALTMISVKTGTISMRASSVLLNDVILDSTNGWLNIVSNCESNLFNAGYLGWLKLLSLKTFPQNPSSTGSLSLLFAARNFASWSTLYRASSSANLPIMIGSSASSASLSNDVACLPLLQILSVHPLLLLLRHISKNVAKLPICQLLPPSLPSVSHRAVWDGVSGYAVVQNDLCKRVPNMAARFVINESSVVAVNGSSGRFRGGCSSSALFLSVAPSCNERLLTSEVSSLPFWGIRGRFREGCTSSSHDFVVVLTGIDWLLPPESMSSSTLREIRGRFVEVCSCSTKDPFVVNEVGINFRRYVQTSGFLKPTRFVSTCSDCEGPFKLPFGPFYVAEPQSLCTVTHFYKVQNTMCVILFFLVGLVLDVLNRINELTIALFRRNQKRWRHHFFDDRPTGYLARNWSWRSTPPMNRLYTDTLGLHEVQNTRSTPPCTLANIFRHTERETTCTGLELHNVCSNGMETN